jgi:hypothetical protein
MAENTIIIIKQSSLFGKNQQILEVLQSLNLLQTHGKSIQPKMVENITITQ